MSTVNPKKGDTQTKADFVLSMPETMGPTELVAKAAEKGIELTTKYVSNVRYEARRSGSKKQPRKGATAKQASTAKGAAKKKTSAGNAAAKVATAAKKKTKSTKPSANLAKSNGTTTSLAGKTSLSLSSDDRALLQAASRVSVDRARALLELYAEFTVFTKN